jgi:hypothetical protein
MGKMQNLIYITIWKQNLINYGNYVGKIWYVDTS